MRIALGSIAVALLLFVPTVAHASPTVSESGFTVRKLATVPQPVGITVAPDGTLYVGNDPPGNGSGEPARIRQVSADGSTVTEIGPLLADPDTLIFDAAGDLANAGEVIVGVNTTLVRLDPATGATSTLTGGYPIANVAHMAFDDAGRLFIASSTKTLAMVSGGSVYVFTTFGSMIPSGVTHDGNGMLYASTYSGTLHGVPLDGSPVTLLATVGAPIDDVAYGTGAFGNRVFIGDQSGNILVYNPANGQTTPFAQGFASVTSLEFGPDGSLFVSDFPNNAIWVIEAPASLDVAPGTVEFGDVAAVWSTKTGEVTLSNSGSGDIVVSGVSLTSSSDASFSITSSPASGTVIGAGSTATVEVLFAPDDVGDFAGTLVVSTNDPSQPTVEVPLSGSGVDADLTGAEMLALLIDLYGDYTDAGLLVGTGRGRSAACRLNTHFGMLVSTARLVNKGYHGRAIAQLAVALERADGKACPPDFVTGDGAPRVAFLIQVVMEEIQGVTSSGRRWHHRSHHKGHRYGRRHHRHGK